MRFLSWVVKVTYGASSRVQGLGEKTCGPALLPPCLSFLSMSLPPPLPKEGVGGGEMWQKGAFLVQWKWLKGLGFRSQLYH